MLPGAYYLGERRFFGGRGTARPRLPPIELRRQTDNRMPATRLNSFHLEMAGRRVGGVVTPLARRPLSGWRGAPRDAGLGQGGPEDVTCRARSFGGGTPRERGPVRISEGGSAPCQFDMPWMGAAAVPVRDRLRIAKPATSPYKDGRMLPSYDSMVKHHRLHVRRDPRATLVDMHVLPHLMR